MSSDIDRRLADLTKKVESSTAEKDGGSGDSKSTANGLFQTLCKYKLYIIASVFVLIALLLMKPSFILSPITPGGSLTSGGGVLPPPTAYYSTGGGNSKTKIDVGKITKWWLIISAVVLAVIYFYPNIMAAIKK